MQVISASPTERGLLDRHERTPEHASLAVKSAEEGISPAGDHITRGERHARRSKLPSLKSIANAVISVGVGAGVYRLGEFAHANLHRNAEPSAPAFVKIGNLQVNRTLVDDFHQFAKIMEQDPKTNETLQFLLNAKPDVFGNPLTIDNVGADYNVLTNTIGWDPKEKLLVPNSNSSEQLGGTSPLGSLTHEALHAQHASENLPAMLVRLACVDPNYDNKEERLTIEQTNAKLANFPGEARRTDHHIGVYVPANNVTDNSLANLSVNPATPQGNSTIDKSEDIQRDPYSIRSDYFSHNLAALCIYPADTFVLAQPYRSYFPNSLNNTNLARVSALAAEGLRVTLNYGNARNGLNVPGKFIEADADYTRRVYDFAANLYPKSGDKDSAACASGAS